MPKYQDIKRAIYERIAAGEFTAGMVLPPERVLIEQYQVSRITIRQAIAGLVAEGVLYTSQGKGTFVRNREGDLNLVRLTSCTEDIKNLGYRPTKKVVSKEIEIANANLRADLRLNEGDRVFRLSRIFYANKITVNFTITNLVYARFPGIENFDFGYVSLYDTLRNNYGLQILRAQRKIEAVLPSEQVADHLRMSTSTPILLFSSITFGVMDSDIFPFESYTSWYRSDRYSFYLDQNGGGADTSEKN